jgi:hypothetical protein
VTQSFATQLFQQFKAIGGIGDQTINQVIKSLGKLNSVFSDVGPDFARNLVQIFQQGFERADIKEALGRIPIFEQLLKSAFGTDDPDKLRKLQQAGQLTLGGFLEGFSNAIETDPRFKNIQESLGGKTAKAFDETKQKLAELGEKLLRDIIPILDKLIPPLNTIIGLFERLPVGLQAATLAAVAFAPALNTLAGAVGGLRVALVSLGGFLLSPGGIAALAAMGFAVSSTQLENLLNNKIPANVANAINPQGLEFNPAVTGPRAIPLIPGADTRLGGLGAVTGGAKTGGLDFSSLAGAAKKGRRRKGDFSNDFGLNEAELVAHEAELARISASNNAVAARRAQAAAVDPLFFAQSRVFDLKEAQKAIDDHMAVLGKAAEKELKQLEPVLSNSERFMRGFADATLSVGDAFDNFGRSVASAFTNVRDLFNGLKQAVLGFFNDLLGSTLQNLVRGTLGPLFGRAGGLAFAGGITAPPSVSATGGLSGFLSKIFGGGGGGESGSASGGASSIIPGFSLSGLGGSLAAAAPLLGLGLGSGFGGTSTAGRILGAVGGGAVGLGVSFGASIFGAGGGLAQAALAAAGPIALIGAPLIVGAILLGKASQRKKDEEAAGEFQRQAHAALAQLKAGIANDSIDGSQARAIFENQILAQFISQISALKTRSVVESRLTNQVRDIRAVFESIITPEIAAQVARRQTKATNALNFSRQIPEFATGGTTLGGLALLHPGEKVVNLQQQATMRAIAGPNIFERAGVPGVKNNAIFDTGGTFGRGLDPQPIEITLQAQVVIGKGDATRIVVVGANSPQGRAVTVKNVEEARRNREL